MGGIPSRRPDDPFGIAGTVLERKYRIDAVVAEGGYGVVYRAHHLSLDTAVAIKVLKRSHSIELDRWDDVLAQFLDEAKTLAKLRHPNIVAVLDSGVAHFDESTVPVPWMALEWLDGRTLFEDMAARRGRGGRTPAECMEIARPVLEAIAFAHDAGVVHRDIKPSNVMLLPAATGVAVRVLDFGIAKIIEPEMALAGPTGHTATQSRVASFTLASAAPEQLAGSRTGPWTDVFSLGLLLVEMLTDAAPLPASDRAEHLCALFSPERPTPGSVGVDVGAWEAVLARALAVRAVDRQASARALLDELVAALPGEGQDGAARVTSVPPPKAGVVAANVPPQAATGDPAPAPARPRRIAVGALGALFLAASGGLVALRGRTHAPDPPRPAVASGRECDSSRACAQAHEGAFVCAARGVCVPVASEDCVAHAEPGDLSADGTAWLGLMAPASEPEANGAELARRDFDAALRISPKTSAGLPRRRVALVACDDTRDPLRVARHLRDDVGVAGIIGYGSAKEALDLLAPEIMPGGIVSMLSRNMSSLLTSIPEPAGSPRLVWRTTDSTNQLARTLSAFYAAYLEPKLVAERGRPLRVAVLRYANVTGMGFVDSLVSSLRMGGASVAEAGSRFREIVVPQEDHSAEASPLLLAPLVAQRPDVVLFPGEEFVAWAVRPLEALWPRDAPRPTYLSGFTVSDAQIAGSSPSLRARLFAAAPRPFTAPNAKFILHYNATFAEPVTPPTAPSTTYDAFFAFAYAASTLPPGPVRGADVALALPRLAGPGPRIEVGPAQILEALGVLDGGGTIDLDGTYMNLDFDPATGETPTDHVLLCVGTGADGNLTMIPSGLTWDAKTGALRGKIACDAASKRTAR